MKKYFHPLLILISILAIPTFTQATEPLPQGYLMTVSSVLLGDIKSVSNAELRLHLFRPLSEDQNPAGWVSTEHHVLDSWTGMNSYEESARLPRNANVFLPKEAVIDNSFYVCFELQGVGKSCKIIPVSKSSNSLYLSTGKDVPSFAVLKYSMSEATVFPMTTSELTSLDPSKTVLIQMDNVDLSPLAQSNFQIRIVNRQRFMYGSFEMNSALDSATVKSSNFTVCVPGNFMITAYRYDTTRKAWDLLPLGGIKIPDKISDPAQQKMSSVEGAKFSYRFYSIIPKSSQRSWLDTNITAQQKAYNWWNTGERDVETRDNVPFDLGTGQNIQN